jgi:uncharacterized membrane protein SpoIIM required for sporulation
LIVNLQRFLAKEQPYWNELEGLLSALEDRLERRLELDEAMRFHYLYQRTASDLAKLADFPAEPQLHQTLAALVTRAYAEIHETRSRPRRLAVRRFLSITFPRTFRRHLRFFIASVAITLAGTAFGAGALYFDPDTKAVLMPFSHLQGDPRERVREEEEATGDRLAGQHTAFSAMLMTHNTKVSIFTFSLGMTYGVGTVVMLFYNGVILGAVGVDYIRAGEGKFLAGWLLPHGVIEIPAILVAGMAGLLLARTLIGAGDRASLRERLRLVIPDLVTLIFGVAALLVWAGIVEAFFSQYHEPVLPYWLKIGFGCAELLLFTLYLARAGRKDKG